MLPFFSFPSVFEGLSFATVHTSRFFSSKHFYHKFFQHADWVGLHRKSWLFPFSWIDPNSAWKSKSKMSEVNKWSNRLIAIWTEINNFEKTSPYFTLVVRSYTPICLSWKLPNLYSLISDVPQISVSKLKIIYKKTSARKQILQLRRSSWKVRSFPLWTK